MERYSVVIAPHAKKQIERLHPSIRSRIANALIVLASDPFTGKALKWDLKGLYSYRIGDHRIIYSIFKQRLIIEVIKVMHRREAYR